MSSRLIDHPKAKFYFGRILIGLKLRDQLPDDKIFALMGRHQSGDWGDADESTRELNRASLGDNSMVQSCYKIDNLTVIITTDLSSGSNETRVYLSNE